MTEQRRFAIPMPDGPDVVIAGEFPLTEAQWNLFVTILDAMKPGLVKEPPAAAEEPEET